MYSVETNKSKQHTLQERERTLEERATLRCGKLSKFPDSAAFPRNPNGKCKIHARTASAMSALIQYKTKEETPELNKCNHMACFIQAVIMVFPI